MKKIYHISQIFMSRFKWKVLTTLTLFALQALNAFAQEIPIGTWRSHLPFQSIISVVEVDNIIYGATREALLYFNKTDNSLNRLSKVEGLSDVGISRLAASEERKTLIVAYTNGNIDLINQGQVYNVSDIKRSNIIGSRSIQNIRVDGRFAYLATGFGVVKFDLDDKVIRESYYFGPNGQYVNTLDIALTPEYLYAATENGIFRVEKNANMADFTKWEKMHNMPYPEERYNAIEYFSGKIIANLNKPTIYNADTLFIFDGLQWDYFYKTHNSSVYQIRSYNDSLLVPYDGGVDFYNSNHQHVFRIYNYMEQTLSPAPRDAIICKDRFIWIADNRLGLIRTRRWQQAKSYTTNGPRIVSAYDMNLKNRHLWVATGGITGPFHNQWRTEGIMHYKDFKWDYYHKSDIPELEFAFDFVQITPDPSNASRAFASSWYNGIYQLGPEGLEAVYNDQNSSLQKRSSVNDNIRIGGSAFDKAGNLWVTNSEVEKPISVRKANGQWLAFSTNSLTNSSTHLSKIIVDSYGQKWAQLGRLSGILVFKENTLENANDYAVRIINSTENQGGLPSSTVFAIAEDLDRNIWIGTDKGATVIYNPQRVLTGEAINAQQILVELGGFYGPLLESEVVTCIAVDGANKKWFGTERSGAFLMSPDGRTLITHFTAENSPLFSNNILSIAIDDVSGEVYFGTDKGIASYRGMATKAEAEFTEVLAFPNPVRENYNGYIAIKGLVRNANVKITDIAGNLIFETIAEGGQAIWNGRKFSGERPATGVYLVFASNDDGSQTLVTKILFVN